MTNKITIQYAPNTIYRGQRFLTFSKRLSIKKIIMVCRLAFILFGIVVTSATYGYRMPQPPSPPFLDLEILHNNLHNLQDIWGTANVKNSNQLQPNTQKILQAILAEIFKLEVISQTLKPCDWSNLVSD